MLCGTRLVYSRHTVLCCWSTYVCLFDSVAGAAAAWCTSYPADQLLILVSEVAWEERNYSAVGKLLGIPMIDLSSGATQVSLRRARTAGAAITIPLDDTAGYERAQVNECVKTRGAHALPARTGQARPRAG